MTRWILVLLVIAPAPIAAQSTTPVQPKVVYVQKLRAPENYAELKDLLTIKVEKLQDWRKANATAPIMLFLDGIELKNLPLSVTTVPGSTTDGLIKVPLEVDDKDANNRKTWVLVLKGAKNKRQGGRFLRSRRLH